MKHFFLTAFWLLLAFDLSGQVTLDECRTAAQLNYPLARQYRWIELSGQYALENTMKKYLPQLSLSAKATYQSEVTHIPFDIPGIDFDGVPNTQYQTVLELDQRIWDGGETSQQKKQVQASTMERQKQVEVDMYAVNERVDQLFFSILLMDEQLRQNRLLTENLERNLAAIDACRLNGTASDADVDAVRVEILHTRQEAVQIQTMRKAYIRMLSLLAGKDWNEQTSFVCPPEPESDPLLIRRPELSWYEARQHQLDIRRAGLKTGYLPKFSFFVQGGFGNPGLNMLENKASFFYLAGVRLNWNFGSLYTLGNDRRKIDAEQRQIETDRDVFLFNTRLQLTEQDGTIQALEQQMKEDDEIIRLRTNIRKAAEVKAVNGTISVTEMLREVTAESLAMQSKAAHRIEWLMHLYRQRHLTNSGE